MKNIKIIKVSNPYVLLLQALEDEKILDLSIKKDSYLSIKTDREIQNIFSQYKKKKYFIGITESGDEDPKVIMSKILKYELKKITRTDE